MTEESPSFLFTKQPESGIVPAGGYFIISWSTNFTALRVWLFVLEPGMDKPGENAKPLQKLSDEEIACGEAEIFPSDKELILAVWYGEGSADYVLSMPFTVTTTPEQKDESVNVSDDVESVGDASMDDPLQEDVEQSIDLDRLPTSEIPGFFPESVSITSEDGIMVLYCFWDSPICTFCPDEPAFRISWETSFVPTKVTITFDSIGTTVTLTENLSTSMYYDLPFESTEVSNTDFHVVAFLDDTGVGSGVVAIPWNSLAFTQEPVVDVNDNRTFFHIGWETNFVPTGVEIGYLTDGSFHSFAAYTEGLSRNMTFDLPFDDAIDEDLIARAYYGAGRYVDSAAFDLPWNGLPSAITIIHSCAFGNNLSIGYLIKVSDLEGYSDFWLDVSGTELRNCTSAY